MSYRLSIVELAIELFRKGQLPKEFPVNDIEKDYKGIREALKVRGEEKNIGTSVDRERKTIWFRKRR